MTRLSVNINKIATIRNARGGNTPDVVKAAVNCERFGAEGITVHPRPDERHITRKDVYALKEVVKTEFNIEGYPSSSFLNMVCEVKPEQVTLVPDPPDVLTSSDGWNTKENLNFLKDVVLRLKENGIRTSLFLEPDLEMLDYAAQTETNRIEFYTGPYAENFSKSPEKAVKPYADAVIMAQKLGLGVNAGHDLSLENLQFFKRNLKVLDEVSIGHALISDALYYGLENTIQMYLQKLDKY